MCRMYWGCKWGWQTEQCRHTGFQAALTPSPSMDPVSMATEVPSISFSSRNSAYSIGPSSTK